RLARAEQRYARGETAFPQQAGSNKSVTAVVAGSAQDHDASVLRRKRRRTLGHGKPRAFHQQNASGARRHRPAVSFRHFSGGQDFEHGQTMRLLKRALTVAQEMRKTACLLSMQTAAKVGRSRLRLWPAASDFTASI